MMKKSFIFKAEYHRAAEGLDDEKYGRLMRMVNEYALNGYEIPTDDTWLRSAFNLIRAQIDESSRRRFFGGKK